MIVDFHVHSNASDGTCAPAEIAAKATKGDFTAIALTDHDNCDGIAEFLSTSRSHAQLIPGIELSIEPGKSFDRFHLLGLNIDPENADLKALLREVVEKRNERNERIIARFAEKGIVIDPEDIASYAHGEVLARPHFACWLLNHGYVKTIKEGFDKYLADDAPVETSCYEERWHPEQERVLKVIHGAGGLAVMAHPKYWRSYWKKTGPEYEDAERELYVLKEKGLDGLEALYQANTVEENIRFTRLADRLGFLKTAGSDFHGENKPTIPLGMTVTDEFIAPFLERLG